MNHIDMEVRQMLRDLQLSDAVKEEIFAEIAGHLHLVAEDSKKAGIDAYEAERQALSQLGDVNKLRKGIQWERRTMIRESFRKVWIPAAVVVLLVFWSQEVIHRFFPEPRTYHIFGTYYVYSWGWLLAEACAGAIGAWWCRSVGGSVRERLIVALAPAEAMGIVIALALPLDAARELLVEHRIPYFVAHPLMFLAATLWVLHSAVPSLVGAFPFIRGEKRTQAPENAGVPA